MRKRLLSSACACVCATIAITLTAPLASANAATFDVDTTADTTVAGGCTTAGTPCSLRDAVNAANASADPSDRVNIPAGTYKLTQGSLPVDTTMTLAGENARNTVIDANGTGRVISASAGDISVTGLTLTGGNGSVGAGSASLFDGDGGAILLGSFGAPIGPPTSSPNLTLTDSTIRGNSAPLNGGGIGTASFESIDTSDITIVRSTISDNHVTGGSGGGFGGGVESFGNLTITNSTITGNSVENASASNTGGGVSEGFDPSALGSGTRNLTILNSTIAGNSITGTAPGGMGGGLAIQAAGSGVSVDVKNTIVADNSVDGATADCSGATTVTSDHNLSSDASCGFTDAGSLPSTEPQLGSLGDNGGPTDTRKPTSTSPVIDAGTDTGCAATDQRGNVRPQGAHCDMGALEQAGADLVVHKVGPLGNVNPGDDVTYRVTAENIGDRDASFGSLSDALPPHVTFRSVSSPPGWSTTTPAAGSGGTIISTIPTLAAGKRGTFTIVVRVDGDAPAAAIANTASVGTTTPETSFADNDDTATFNVNSVPPRAFDDSAAVAEDSGATTIGVLANDVVGNTGGSLQVQSVTQPTHGTAAVGTAGGNVTYAPGHDFCGSDSFTYTLTSGSTATVSVAVSCVDDPPVATDDSATVDEDSGATTIDVLANDSDVDGGPKTVDSVTQPAHGTAAITAGGGSVTYTPAADFCGSDTFKYTLNGGSQGAVSITVTCEDDPPHAVDDSKTVAAGSGATTIDVLANDTDVDGGPKTVASATQPSHGTSSVASDGSSVSYQPAGGFCGSDSFTYALNGGSSATVSITVTCAPPIIVTPSSIRISHRHVGLEHGFVLLVLKCRGARGQHCRGSLSINPASGRRRLKAAAAYGTARFDIRTGKNQLVRIKMPASVTQRLKRRPHKLIAEVVARLIVPGERSPRLYHRRITIIAH